MMELRFEFDDEAKTIIRPFCVKAKTWLSSQILQNMDVLYGPNTARIFMLNGETVEQALFIQMAAFDKPVITASLILFDHVAPSSKIYDGLCGVCSTRYITEDERPFINILHKFDKARQADVIAAIDSSRLKQYEQNSYLACFNAPNINTSTYCQVVDYWKHA